MSANIEVIASKWSASEAVEDSESRLEFEKKKLGNHQNNRAGLGSITTQKIPTKKHSRLLETNTFCGRKVRL